MISRHHDRSTSASIVNCPCSARSSLRSGPLMPTKGSGHARRGRSRWHSGTPARRPAAHGALMAPRSSTRRTTCNNWGGLMSPIGSAPSQGNTSCSRRVSVLAACPALTWLACTVACHSRATTSNEMVAALRMAVPFGAPRDAGVDLLRQQFTRSVSTVARSLQARIRIGAHRQQLLLAAEPVLQAPPTAAAGRDLQVQAALVIQSKRLVTGLGRADLGVAQHAVWGQLGSGLEQLPPKLASKLPPIRSGFKRTRRDIPSKKRPPSR